MRRSILLSPLLLMPLAVLAQPDAGTLLNQQQRQQQRFPDRLPEAERQPVRPALKPTAGARVVVKSIRFSGAVDLASEAELQAIVANAIGKELDFAGIEQLARSVTEFLRSRGWFLAEAYLPQQDITDGHIEINIRPGRLDGSDGKGKSFEIIPGGKLATRIDSNRLAAIAAHRLPAGTVAHEGDLERAMLLMNDLPGVTARARLEPGQESGSTHVAVDVEEGPLVTGSVGIDNYGNRDTGAAQLNLAAQLNDPLGIGDQGSVTASATQGLDIARLAYSLPIGSEGLKLGTTWSAMDYRIVRGTGLAAGLKGSSETGGVTLTYPVIRSRNNNLYTAIGYNRKALKDDSTAGLLKDKRVDSWNANLFGDKLDAFGGGGFTSWNVGWTQGKLDLSRISADQTADALGYGTQGSYDKLGYGVSRLQKMPHNFSFFANFSGQTAGKNLDSSEKFILGGPNGVRAYPGSEASGDSGGMVNLELRYDLPSSSFGQLQMVGFYDAGSIKLHDDPKAIAIPTYSGQNAYALSGWGLGFNLSKTGSHMVRLGWARKIGDNPGSSVAGLDADSRTDKSRVWLQATLWF